MIRLLIDARLMFYRKAGISQYTRHLLRALAPFAQSTDDSLTLNILLDRRDHDLDWLPTGPNIRVLRAITPAHHRYEWLTLPFELARLQLRHRFNWLHSPDFITARGRFKKLITIHDLYFMQHPEVMSRDGARYYGRVGWSAMQADAIIAVSEFTRHDIYRLLPNMAQQKVWVVHEAAEFANDRATSSDSTAPYALFVGTAEPRKNLITLLTALAQLRQQGRLPADFKLGIAGAQGWAGDTPQHMAQMLGVSDVLDMLGEVDQARLHQLYCGARMLLLPSHYEGFGLTALEAMIRGTPVICSNAGSLPEIVGEAARLHDPLDMAALSEHIWQLWHDAAIRRDYAARGLVQAQRFSWARAAHETLQIMKKTA
ncbi:MAG: glycosyltransferase family 4 protein [Anaerolineae bacterium]|nr:glycosyltransferase family 4 protein [Anaerolineae bacterium]